MQRHRAQVKARAPASVVHQFRKGVGQAARTHIVDRQDGVAGAQRPALVDDLLRPALDFRVAALHRVKVQRRSVGTGGHGAGGAAAHADAHARPAQLHQQRTGRKGDFLRLPGIDGAQAAGHHDRLVVTALHAGHGLLVFAEIAQQVGPAKFVVERGAAQRALRHDLQRAGNVLGCTARLVAGAVPQFGHAETGEARLGRRTPAGGAFVADFAAGAGGRAGERRDGSGVVVRFHLHQHMLQSALFLIAAGA